MWNTNVIKVSTKFEQNKELRYFQHFSGFVE